MNRRYPFLSTVFAKKKLLTKQLVRADKFFCLLKKQVSYPITNGKKTDNSGISETSSHQKSIDISKSQRQAP